MNEHVITRASEIIAGKTGGGFKGYCALALIDLDGFPSATTISISKADGIRWLTFCTGLGPKAERIAHCNKASVCINSEEYNITLIGTIEVLTDAETKKEMWYPGLQDNFPGGWEDPNYCVLKFTTQRYNLMVDWQEDKDTL